MNFIESQSVFKIKKIMGLTSWAELSLDISFILVVIYAIVKFLLVYRYYRRNQRKDLSVEQKKKVKTICMPIIVLCITLVVVGLTLEIIAICGG